MIRPRSLLALWGWLVVRTLLRRRWLQLLLLRSESGGWRVSPAFRATWADLVARMPLAGLRPLASSVEEWDARCGELLALLRRCALVVGRGAGAVQPPRFLVTRLPPTVPKHPMQNLWHAIEPKFLAEGVASVSQDRRRGAGSTPVSTAPLPPPPALGSPVAPFVRASLAALPCGARAFLERGLHHLLVWCPPAPDGDWAVSRWRIASRDWPPLKATRTSTVPKHPMQNLWHAIEPKFLAEDVASVSQDRRRGAGSIQVSLAAVMAPCVWLTSPPAPLSLHARPLPERSSSMNSVCTTRPIKRRPSYGPGLWTAA